MITRFGKKYPHLNKKDLVQELREELQNRNFYYDIDDRGNFDTFNQRMFDYDTPDEVWDVWNEISQKYFNVPKKIR